MRKNFPLLNLALLLSPFIFPAPARSGDPVVPYGMDERSAQAFIMEDRVSRGVDPHTGGPKRAEKKPEAVAAEHKQRREDVDPIVPYGMDERSAQAFIMEDRVRRGVDPHTGRPKSEVKKPEAGEGDRKPGSEDPEVDE